MSTIFQLHSSNLKFYSVNSLYGISMREVASVCKDKRGFIWASSKAGVLRIAGNDYRVYKLPYENADIISVKLVYTNTGLLGYTNNGQLFKYNEITDMFDLLISMTKRLNNKHISVNNVLLDKSGTYWISSSYGLYCLKNNSLNLVQDREDCYYIGWYDANSLLVASPTGVYLLDINTKREKWLYKNAPKLGFQISKLYYDSSKKKLWIGTTTSGLFCYDMRKQNLSRINFIPTQPILAIETKSDSTILVGIDGQGLWEINKQGSKILNVYKEDVNNPSSLKGNGVYDIFNDQGKRIWICTYTGGVSFFDQTSSLVTQTTHQINNNNSLVNNNVNNILQDKKGNIWFATDNGISCKEARTGNWKTFYQNQQNQTTVFLSLCEDDYGRIWAGTYSSGIYVLDANTGRQLAHYSKEASESTLRSNFVIDILKDHKGDLWIGGVQGNLVCYLSKENKFKSFAPQPINTYAELSSNQLLLACTYGLCLFDKKSGTTRTLLEGYLVQDVISINGEIWLCTSGEGLINYNRKTNKIKKFTIANGLPSNYVNSIMLSGGYLWLGTEAGLCRFNPRDQRVVTYNTIYPLSRVSFNRSSHCKLRDGQLIWGTSNGAVQFSPESLTGELSKGSIFFQDLTLAGHSIRPNLTAPLDSLQELQLKYDQNTLHLELLAIGCASDARFSWKLDGFDNDWSQPSDNRSIHYSNIPSGNYVLKIRLYDGSLSHLIAERILPVTVVPPFWRSWWFALLFFIFFVVVIYMSLRYYVERLKQQHTEEKVRFFTNTAHDFRTSLTLVKAPIEELNKEQNLSDGGKYYLSLAIEQVRRLSTVVTQLMDFQKIDVRKEQLALSMVDIVALIEHRKLMFESTAQKQGVTLCFESNINSYQTAIDEPMIEKVIDNLVSNAIKYSQANSEVKIMFHCEATYWILKVEDHGIGISAKAKQQLFREFYRGENAINSKVVGSGIGLLLIKNYVELHNGSISYVSEESIGSTFKIVIPFREAPEESKQINDKGLELVPLLISDLPPALCQTELSPQTMRILIVEDNDDLRNFMQYPLQADFEVELAKDGAEAWAIIQKRLPDLVVSDVMMPQMDGFELCKLMKSTYETSHIPVILLTALSGKVEQLHGLGLGADDYLIKPFDMTLLIQKIKSIIKNRETVKEKALKLIKGSGDNDQQILSNELNDKFMKKMLEVVRTNMANAEFGKDDFASALNVSTSLLYKKVKALTDLSPTDFIKCVRMDFALELLQSKNYSVTEVSELCGFSSNGYFSTVFKKHFGKSPTNI